ncbi:hypothetical protein MKX01_016927 [Papaver californicum]|nr:hypothetical protein MKX01_016927 [Papaver californicum]
MNSDETQLLAQIRENARLQGFFDHYKLCGEVKDKYTQVGNAVAVPVAKALGYALSLAVKGHCDDEPLIKLPNNFAFALEPLPYPSIETENRAVQEHLRSSLARPVQC